MIDMEEFTDLKRLIDGAKEQLTKHFLQRDAENAAGVVNRWKQEDVYPFEGSPKDFIEETERQIFDVVAVSLDSYVSELRESKSRAKS